MMTVSAANVLLAAWRGVTQDQDFLREISTSYVKRNRLLALWADGGLHAAFLIRLITGRGPKWLSILARNRLISRFACDVNSRATVLGSLYLPHPIGIVIGAGSVIHPQVRIYHGVTLGSNGQGGYPTIESGVIIFPNTTIVGPVRVGSEARVGANRFLDHDVEAGATVFAISHPHR